MTERPILFSGPMVRAVLDGRKTQTRRVIKHVACSGTHELSPKEMRPGEWFCDECYASPYRCPYGAPGSKLWIRETFGCHCHNSMQPMKGCELVYRADDPGDIGEYPLSGWRPSVFMPRWASRITLDITGLRVERLQDISGDDVLAEGIPEPCRSEGHPNDRFQWFRGLWDSINGQKAPWESNPWVWIVSFERARE